MTKFEGLPFHRGTYNGETYEAEREGAVKAWATKRANATGDKIPMLVVDFISPERPEKVIRSTYARLPDRPWAIQRMELVEQQV